MTDPSAATPAGGSVIHDLGYRPYTGPRVGPGAIARALTLTGFRNAFGLGRSGKSKVLPFILLALNLMPAVIVGGVLDMGIGAAITCRRTARRGLWAALLVSVLYVAAGTLLASRLWADPLGPFLKILPIVVLNLVALAVLEDR